MMISRVSDDTWQKVKSEQKANYFHLLSFSAIPEPIGLSVVTQCNVARKICGTSRTARNISGQHLMRSEHSSMLVCNVADRQVSMTQQTLAMVAAQGEGFEHYRRPTKRDAFLATMERLVWCSECRTTLLSLYVSLKIERLFSLAPGTAPAGQDTSAARARAVISSTEPRPLMARYLGAAAGSALAHWL